MKKELRPGCDKRSRVLEQEKEVGPKNRRKKPIHGRGRRSQCEARTGARISRKKLRSGKGRRSCGHQDLKEEKSAMYRKKNKKNKRAQPMKTEKDSRFGRQ